MGNNAQRPSRSIGDTSLRVASCMLRPPPFYACLGRPSPGLHFCSCHASCAMAIWRSRFRIQGEKPAWVACVPCLRLTSVACCPHDVQLAPLVFAFGMQWALVCVQALNVCMMFMGARLLAVLRCIAAGGGSKLVSAVVCGCVCVAFHWCALRADPPMVFKLGFG